MQQELPGPSGYMVGPCAQCVLRYVNVMQPDFPVRDLREPISQRCAASAQRFHLGTGERDARLEDILDRVVMPGTPVPGNDLVSLLACHVSPVSQPACVHVATVRSRRRGAGGAGAPSAPRLATPAAMARRPRR